jgi:hypothetical protein
LDAILAGVLRALGYGGPLSQPWLRLAAAAVAIVLALVLSAGALAAARAIIQVIQPQPTVVPTSAPPTTAPALALIALDGPIEQIAQEGWVVGGTTVVLTSTTLIEGTPALGAPAHVRGVVQNGGALLARSIVVEPLPASPSISPIVTPTATPAPTVTPALTVTPIPVVPAPAPPDVSDQPDDQKQPCQGQQRGRDEKKCDPKPHDNSKPPKPKPPKK